MGSVGLNVAVWRRRGSFSDRQLSLTSLKPRVYVTETCNYRHSSDVSTRRIKCHRLSRVSDFNSLSFLRFSDLIDNPLVALPACYAEQGLWNGMVSVRLSVYLSVSRPRLLLVAGLSGRVVGASDCGVRGPRFESRRGQLCLSRLLLWYTVLGTDCAPLLQCLSRLSLLPSVGR